MEHDPQNAMGPQHVPLISNRPGPSRRAPLGGVSRPGLTSVELSGIS
ncbi:Uncharacterised protein [Mycobacteroides abscessus subsp. abscessus]|nr:Uncharacterised protein [Mycobacteroides abscessus subsp. abscessus]